MARGHRDGVASCPVIPWTQPREPAEHRAIPRKARFYGLERLHGASAAASGSCGGTVGLKSPFTWAGAADRRTAALGLGLGVRRDGADARGALKTASDGRRRVVWSRSTTATYPRSRPRYLVALLLDRPCRPLWVYRPVKRSSPDTCGRKPLKNPGVVGAAIGFKSPSSHS